MNVVRINQLVKQPKLRSSYAKSIDQSLKFHNWMINCTWPLVSSIKLFDISLWFLKSRVKTKFFGFHSNWRYENENYFFFNREMNGSNVSKFRDKREENNSAPSIVWMYASAGHKEIRFLWNIFFAQPTQILVGF